MYRSQLLTANTLPPLPLAQVEVMTRAEREGRGRRLRKLNNSQESEQMMGGGKGGAFAGSGGSDVDSDAGNGGDEVSEPRVLTHSVTNSEVTNAVQHIAAATAGLPPLIHCPSLPLQESDYDSEEYGTEESGDEEGGSDSE